VSEYGVDQMALLMRKSIDGFTNPFVIVGILTEDLDRSILNFRIGQKPRFEVQGDGLRSVGDKIEPSTKAYLATHPPQISSYLYRALLYGGVLPNRLSEALRGEAEKTRRKRVIKPPSSGPW
jgi:hypothetical protein